MEAFLLTLDVVCMIWLCRGVIRVHRSGDSKDMGLFAYRETPPARDAKRGPHA